MAYAALSQCGMRFFILASKNANDIEKMCIIYNMHDLFFFYGINL